VLRPGQAGVQEKGEYPCLASYALLFEQTADNRYQLFCSVPEYYSL
jgi:hypothetical protein